jgi:hypothetical protein
VVDSYYDCFQQAQTQWNNIQCQPYFQDALMMTVHWNHENYLKSAADAKHL